MVGEWSELDDAAWRVFGGLHRLLLRLAGRVPDDWLAHARTMLGSGELGYLPDLVAGSVVELGLPLTAEEVDLLRRVPGVLGDVGEPPAALDQVPVSVDAPAVGHRFAPVPPEVLVTAGVRIPARLDLTGGGSDQLWDLPAELADLAELADDLTDHVDDAVVTGLARYPGVVGVWRAWRYGPAGPPVDGKRVYLAEVEQGVRAWDLAHEAQRELDHAGEESPQVEVYWTGDPLPAYQLAARAGSALLWAGREAGGQRPVDGVTRFRAELARDPDLGQQ